jgi:hypothetical protein
MGQVNGKGMPPSAWRIDFRSSDYLTAAPGVHQLFGDKIRPRGGRGL